MTATVCTEYPASAPSWLDLSGGAGTTGGFKADGNLGETGDGSPASAPAPASLAGGSTHSCSGASSSYGHAAPSATQSTLTDRECGRPPIVSRWIMRKRSTCTMPSLVG
eukprot:scaffold2584_cov113-Isochrysis_galbana.AAC.7